MSTIHEPVLKMLQERGIEAFVVGGYPRDILLNKEVNDIDLATPVPPEQVVKALKDYILTALTEKTIQYGVVNFWFNNTKYEITTFRIDLENKRNTTVSFTENMENDAIRRDFTINAIYMDRFGFHDPTGHGMDDVKNKKLRTIGSAKKRFQEDPNRILRAIRFMTMGFEAAAEITDFLKSPVAIELLSKISQERITTEFLKIVNVDVRRGILLLKAYGLLKWIIPELEETYGFDQEHPKHRFDLFSHQLFAAQYIQQNGGSVELVLTGLLHDIGKPKAKVWNKKKRKASYLKHEEYGADIVARISHRMKFPNKTQRRMVFLVENHMKLHIAKKVPHFRKIRFLTTKFQNKYKLSGNLLHDLILLWEADNWGKNFRYVTVHSAIYEKIKPNIVTAQQIIHMLKNNNIPAKYNGLAIHKSWYIWLKDYNQTKKAILNSVLDHIKSVIKKEQTTN